MAYYKGGFNVNIKGTKTEEYLWTAFAGESQSRNKYTFFAEIARQQGYEKIASVFEDIANQEKEHAKIMLGFLNGLRDTPSNLRLAANNENYEGSTMYKEFERVARQEGFDEIANFFNRISKIEMDHEKIFLSLLHSIEEKSNENK